MKQINKLLFIAICSTINACSSSQPSQFRIEGIFSNEQIVLLELAQDEWCEAGELNNRKNDFCTNLSSSGDSLFIGIFGIKDYLGIHEHIELHKDEQWASEIKIDSSLSNNDFYNVVKHELGHHFCLQHINNKGIMEPFAGDWENTNITSELIHKGGCEL